MTWNYRVCKSVWKEDGYEEVNFEIHEVYYNKDGSIWAVSSNGIAAHAENVKSLGWTLNKMKEALKKEVIDLDTLVCVPREDVKERTLEEHLVAFNPEKHGGELMAWSPIGIEFPNEETVKAIQEGKVTNIDLEKL